MDLPSTRARSSPFPTSTRTLQKTYLQTYNLISLLLWATILLRLLSLLPLVGVPPIVDALHPLVRFTQSLALLEPLHALAGLVRAPLLTTTIQIASRILLVWPVVGSSSSSSSTTTGSPGGGLSGGLGGLVGLGGDTVGRSTAYPLMLLAWSATEVVRYAYFVEYLRGGPAGALRGVLGWLRYNTFYVLYPLGIGSEMWLVYKAIGPASRSWSGWEWVLRGILGIYVPGSYIMYTHMMRQRRRMIRGKQAVRAG